MPVLWRYFLGRYFKVLLLSLLSFVSIGMVTRLQEVGQFAALGTQARHIFSFVLYQIPFIFPLALPISSLIATFVLFQDLSRSGELTALRTAGFAFRKIFAPILLVGVFLGIVNFYCISELATHSRLQTRRMADELVSSNPLLLLHAQSLLRSQDAYVQASPKSSEKEASEIFFAIRNAGARRLSLLSVPKLTLEGVDLIGHHAALISHSAPKVENAGFDHLFLDNLGRVDTPALEFANLLKRSGWRLREEYLALSLLLVHIREQQRILDPQVSHLFSKGRVREAGEGFNRGISEVFRRISIALAAFVFPFMGAAFAVDCGREPSKKGILWILLLSTVFLTCFLSAKGASDFFWEAAALYFLPHFLLLFMAGRAVNQQSRGLGL